VAFRAFPRDLSRINQFDARTLAAFREALRRYGKASWVTGVTIAIKQRRNQLSTIDGPVIAIHVTKKLRPGDVPRSRSIPRRIGGIPTDVVGGSFTMTGGGAGVAVPGQAPIELRPGVSIGRQDGTSSTMTGVVAQPDGTRMLLCTAHALQEGSHDDPGDPIVHPGPTDSANPQVVARYTDVNLDVDAGIAELEPGVLAVNITRVTQVSVLSPVYSAVGAILEMNGRSTPTVQGQVTGAGFIQGLYPAMTIRRLPGHPKPITLPGDSGGLWYDLTTHEASGLHVGINKKTGDALATMLPYVLTEMPGGPLTWL